MIDAHDRRLAWASAAFLLAVYVLTFSGRFHSSDERSMLAATDSLARRGAWDTELIRWMGEQQGSFGPDGHLYSRKGIGTTLAALPLYWVALGSERLGNVQAAMLANGLVTALTGALLLLYVRRLGYGRGAALGAALAFGLGTMAWPYARTLFSEPAAALGVVAAAYWLLRYRDRGDAAGLLLAGAGLGLALLARLNNAIVAPFLGLALAAYLYRRHGSPAAAPRRWLRDLALFGLPVAAALAIGAWYNWLRFGSPLVTGYLAEERFSAPFFEGLYGLLLSPGKGLLWYNPLFFASVLAWPAFVRRHRIEALLALAVVVANVVFYAPWYLWWGGHGWGPRFLVAVLPFAALPLAEAVGAARRRRALAAGLGALAVLSVAVQIVGTTVDFNLYLEDIHAELGLYHPATLFNPAYSPLLRQPAYLLAGRLDLAWLRGGAVDAPALAAGILMLVLTGLALWRAWSSHEWPGRRWPAAWLPVLLAAGALFALLRSAPRGDVAAAARLLEAMEQPGEAAVLADPLLIDAFQDAYDGRLPLWGAPIPEAFASSATGTWRVGGDPSGRPAAARFQAGEVALALDLPAGRFFDPSRLPIPVREATRLGDGIELVAAWQATTTVRPGEALPVALAWRALAPLDTSYTVFVQAIDAGGVKAGQLDGLPCGGGCPTTAWQRGEVVGEWLELPLRPDAPPGTYQLIAGLYDLATGDRLPVRGAQGEAMGDAVPFGAIEVLP